MFLYLLLILCTTTVQSADQKIIRLKGNISIPYSKPCTTEQLTAYRKPYMKAFSLHDRLPFIGGNDSHKLLHTPLESLWIPIRAFSQISSDWHICGHPEINEGSTDIQKSFPLYIPLYLLLQNKAPFIPRGPLKLTLYLSGSIIKAKLIFNQEQYTGQPAFATPQDMLAETLTRHYAFCAKELQLSWRTDVLEAILIDKFGQNSIAEKKYKDVNNFISRESR